MTTLAGYTFTGEKTALSDVKETHKLLPVLQLRKKGTGKVVGYTMIRASLHPSYAAFEVTEVSHGSNNRVQR